MDKQKTILVTGGAGFIGSSAIEALLAEPDTYVVCVDNYDDTYDKDFKLDNISGCIAHARCTIYDVDITDRDALFSVFEKHAITHILHLAAKADTRKAVIDPYVYVDTNITGTLNVLEAAVRYDVPHIVAASSSSVYGNNRTLPWSESDYNLHPISPYGVTKLASEHIAYTYHTNHNRSVTMLRFFNVYGERNRPGMVPYIWAESFLTDTPIEISGDGSRRRDYTYIGDIVRGILLALEKPFGYEVINLGYGSPLSLRELLHLFETVTEKKVPVSNRRSHSASVDATYADTTKARTLLGWEPAVSHQEGILRLVSWFKEHRLKN
jgi:UDP-glucuronate 4-epimerase